MRGTLQMSVSPNSCHNLIHRCGARDLAEESLSSSSSAALSRTGHLPPRCVTLASRRLMPRIHTHRRVCIYTLYIRGGSYARERVVLGSSTQVYNEAYTREREREIGLQDAPEMGTPPSGMRAGGFLRARFVFIFNVLFLGARFSLSRVVIAYSFFPYRTIAICIHVESRARFFGVSASFLRAAVRV